jgi:hypothetical protein
LRNRNQEYLTFVEKRGQGGERVFKLPQISEYQWLENYIWLICFACAAAAIAMVVYSNKVETEDKKADDCLTSTCLCSVVFALVFIMLGLANLWYLSNN